LFGYIKVSKGELKIKEYDTYKAVYCSLCKKFGKDYGFLSRLTLSYDFTFLALLNMAMKDSCDGYKVGRCAFNPLKKCNYCNDEDFLEMPAGAATIMLYYKILDNINDEKGIKKLGFLLLKPIYKSAYKKAKNKYPEIDCIVSEFIKEQNELETANCDDLDTACHPTATALSKILMLCSSDEMQKRVLSRLGYCIGKYIYLMDAFCDLSQDIKTKSYNVLKNIKDDKKNRIQNLIYYSINESAKAFELLELKRYKTILGNIIYLGLEDIYLKEKNK